MIRTEDYKRELVSILFAQKNVIFWTAFLIFAGAVAVAFYSPATFSASGAILVSAKQLVEEKPEALQQPYTRVVPVSKEDLASEVEILTSPDVIKKAIRYTAMEYPAFASGPGGSAAADDVYDILKSLKTTVVPASNVISVSYLHGDPDQAVEFLDVLMEQYIIERMRFQGRATTPSPRFYQDQVDRFREDLIAQEEELIKLVNATGVSDPRKEIEANIDLKKSLEARLDGLRNDYIEARLTLENLDQALQSDDLQYFSFLDSLIITELSTDLAELYVQRGNALRTYHPESAVVTAIDDQVKDVYEALRAEASTFRNNVEKNVQGIGEKINSMERTIAGYDDRNVILQEQLVNTGRIARESELLKSNYLAYATRKTEVEIDGESGADAPSIHVGIMSRAFPSDGPVFPRKGVLLPLGLLVGLITGFSLGFAREYFDHTFKKPSDVDTYTGLPVLFSLSRQESPGLKLMYTLVVIAALVGMAGFLLSKFQTMN